MCTSQILRREGCSVVQSTQLWGRRNWECVLERFTDRPRGSDACVLHETQTQWQGGGIQFRLVQDIQHRLPNAVHVPLAVHRLACSILLATSSPRPFAPQLLCLHVSDNKAA